MTTPTTPSQFVTEIKGDLFTLAPDGAVLVHACNTRGQWGAGIAKKFKELYPAAYQVYNTHCKNNLAETRKGLLGTTLLIPPQEGDFHCKDGKGKGNWIACLFTSVEYGKRKGSKEGILAATRGALEDLKTQLEQLRKEEGAQLGEVWGCRFNSMNFGVEWNLSRRVVEDVGVEMVVVELE